MAGISDALKYMAGNFNNRLTNLERQETSNNTDFLIHCNFTDLAGLILPTPANTNGRVRYCSDCCKVGEGAGVGTGVIVYYSEAAWRRITDDAAASH